MPVPKDDAFSPGVPRIVVVVASWCLLAAVLGSCAVALAGRAAS